MNHWIETSRMSEAFKSAMNEVVNIGRVVDLYLTLTDEDSGICQNRFFFTEDDSAEHGCHELGDSDPG